MCVGMKFCQLHMWPCHKRYMEEHDIPQLVKFTLMSNNVRPVNLIKKRETQHSSRLHSLKSFFVQFFASFPICQLPRIPTFIPFHTNLYFTKLISHQELPDTTKYADLRLVFHIPDLESLMTTKQKNKANVIPNQQGLGNQNNNHYGSFVFHHFGPVYDSLPRLCV